MAQQDRPNQNANKSKAEGERETAEQNIRNAGENHPEDRYDGSDTDDAGGITNRPLSDEIENQEALPDRGTNRDQTADPGARRKEGDYQEDER